MNGTSNNTDELWTAISQKLQNGSGDGGTSNDHMQSKSYIDYHNHNSFIAIITLMSFFLVITLSTTGLVLAFCRKKNTVFALQKCEQESEYELDDMDENTDTEICEDEFSNTKQAARSRTFPSFTKIKTDDFPSSPTRTPLVNKTNQFYSSNSDDTLVLSETIEQNGIIRKIQRSQTVGIFPMTKSSRKKSEKTCENEFTTTALICKDYVNNRLSNQSISISMEDDHQEEYNLEDGTLQFLDINVITKEEDGTFINV